MKHIEPKALQKSFTCPHCGAIAQQEWWYLGLNKTNYSDPQYCPLRVGTCSHCTKNTIWLNEKMLHPAFGKAPQPNSEMPPEVSAYYIEAAEIFTRSPRAASALLRLAIQILCKILGEKGKNINDDIASLVKKGLPEIVQQSLDVVRVTGNNAVHPGQIDADSPEVVINLFELTNIIVEYMIAMPKRVSGLYTNLPAKALETIKDRDA